MTEDEQVMAVKLMLAGMAVWSHKEYRESLGKEYTENGTCFAIVKLGTENKDGTYFYEDKAGMGWFSTRREAMEYALERLKVST